MQNIIFFILFNIFVLFKAHQSETFSTVVTQKSVLNNQNYQAEFGGDQIKDQEHIKEHLEGKIDLSKMTPEQLQFYYFNMYDLNKDNKLDGTELIKAITHFHDENSNKDNQNDSTKLPDLELEKMVSSILAEDDNDNDGFITYVEFSYAQKRREEQQQRLTTLASPKEF